MNKDKTSGHGHLKTKEDLYVFRLYVTGASPNSLRAIANTKNLFDEYLDKNYELEIIDVHQQPSIAKQENIIALPLLIKKFPLPEKRLIGDMSDGERVLKSIGALKGDLS
ncbi:MAG TPA: circadian clock KaiB family protein [Chitinophagaceae bacterium]